MDCIYFSYYRKWNLSLIVVPTDKKFIPKLLVWCRLINTGFRYLPIDASVLKMLVLYEGSQFNVVGDLPEDAILIS